jgi:hypothetical protein
MGIVKGRHKLGIKGCLCIKPSKCQNADWWFGWCLGNCPKEERDSSEVVSLFEPYTQKIIPKLSKLRGRKFKGAMRRYRYAKSY